MPRLNEHHLLYYCDAVSNEMSVDLFAVMLVFHGMVLFSADGAEGKRRRFWQLAGRVCVALLLGWHVYGLLLPFLALGVAAQAATAWRGAGGAGRSFAGRLGAVAFRVLRGRSVLLGALTLVFGTGVLGYNIVQEHAAYGGQRAVGGGGVAIGAFHVAAYGGLANRPAAAPRSERGQRS